MSGVKGAGLTKQEIVYRYLRERILGGAYRSGHRIVITKVARELSVSALPVREAIRRLEAEGLISYKPNAGAEVAPPQPDFFEHDMAVLAVLDGYGTALAAPRIPAARLRLLTAITDEMTTAMERLDALTFQRLDEDFHGIIYDACPNPPLTALLRDLSTRLHTLRRTVFIDAPYRGSETICEHRGLATLLAGEVTAAEIESAARGHRLGELDSFRRWHQNHH